MIEQAAPPGVKANVVPVKKMIEVAKDPRFGATKALLLFETPQDALRAIEGGVDIKELNIGSMAHSVGKVAVSKVLSLDEKDIETFEELKKLGRPDIIVIAGGVIPAQDYDFLYKAGVAAIFGPGTPVAKAACQILEILMDEE